jgi:ribosomal protein L11 methyltransferase
MFSIDLECPQEVKDIRIAELWEAGSTGIVELPDAGAAACMRAFFDDDLLATGLQERFGGEVCPADTRDWVAFAREHLQPMEIGERIFVVPEWRDEATFRNFVRGRYETGGARRFCVRHGSRRGGRGPGEF